MLQCLNLEHTTTRYYLTKNGVSVTYFFFTTICFEYYRRSRRIGPIPRRERRIRREERGTNREATQPQSVSAAAADRQGQRAVGAEQNADERRCTLHQCQQRFG